MAVKIEYKYSDIKKPMQPENISVDGLYDYADYASLLFEYSINLFKKKFEKLSGKSCNLFIGPMKDRKRVDEKLNETDIESPSDILDILRATVTLKTVEDLLDFLKYTKTFFFTKKDFNPLSLDKDVLSSIRKRFEKNIMMKYPSITNAEVEKKVDEAMKVAVEQLKNNCKNMGELPSTNVAISNSFSLKVDEKQKQKYDFLSIKSRLKNSNYMDFKFYVCIPIPAFEIGMDEDYIICEVITTLDCFNDVYSKTHFLFEKTRNFKSLPDDDISPEAFNTVFNALSCSMYVDDVITKYNSEHPNSIQIIPHNDNKQVRENLLNSIDSLTVTKALCDCRNYKR